MLFSYNDTKSRKKEEKFKDYLKWLFFFSTFNHQIEDNYGEDR